MNLTLITNGAAGGDSRDQSTTQEHPLGALAAGSDGSLYRYAKAGALLVAGNVIQSPAIVTTHLAMTAAAASLGATSVTFTLGGTNNATANQYAEGWLNVDTTPGNGRRYRIASHPAAALSTALTVQLYPDDPIEGVAWTTATRVGLISNPYNGVIQMPITTATGTLVGVATCALASGSFGWLQTAGMGSPLIAGTPALGAYVMAPGTVAGAAEIITTTNLVVAQLVGRMNQVGVAGKNNACWLMID